MESTSKVVASFPVAHFQAHNRGLKCRMKCGACNRAWSETATETVHMVETPMQKNGKTIGVISYLCTACIQKSQSKT